MSEGRGQSRALAYLFILNFTFIVVGYVLFAHYVNATIRAQQEQAQITQQAQERQALLVERKICTTMHRLAALQPPAGNAAANPSRAYDQELHATLDELGSDLGCR